MLKVYQVRKEGAEEQIRLGCITTKASDDPTGSSEAGTALQGCPMVGHGSQVFNGLVFECRLLQGRGCELG